VDVPQPQRVRGAATFCPRKKGFVRYLCRVIDHSPFPATRQVNEDHFAVVYK
jgi:hypothetical protein